MKSFFSKLKRDDGFTLVELMVVVAIIGVLSAVAIPNFKKYQAKAKVSEAKLQLSSIYTAETAFYGDFNIYHTCLRYMGYDPSPEQASRYYTTGFNIAATYTATTQPYLGATNSGLSTTECSATLAAAEGATYFTAGKTSSAAIVAAATNLTANINVAPTQTTFVAGAAGIVMQSYDQDTGATTGMSKLSINAAKVLATLQNGY